MPAQTFRPSPKKLVGPALTVVVFLAWGAFAFAFVPKAQVPAAGLGLAFIGGVPLLMGALSGVYLLGLMARTTVDDERLTLAGPLGSRSVRWADVVGHDVVGTAKQGVTLYLSDGHRLGVPFLAYEGDALRKAVDARLRRLPPPSIEGREFPIEGRWGFSALFVGGLLFTAVAAWAVPALRQTQALVPLGLLALVLLPFVALLLTDRVALKDGVLTKRTLFGTRSLALADVTFAQLRVVNGKGGPREHLLLVGPTTMRIAAGREGYAMLRDAIVRGLRPGVRPKPLS